MAGLTRWLIRAVLLAAGLVLFLSLFVAAMVLALAWGLRAAWARLTGRPVVPWTYNRVSCKRVFEFFWQWRAELPHGYRPYDGFHEFC